MKFLIAVSVFLLISGCTKSCSKEGAESPEPQIESPVRTAPVVKIKTPVFSKALREAIYFSNSLEREALKLILKDPAFQRLTLFSVLSYIVETDSGAKKSTPYGLDCGKYNIKREGQRITILKACVRPETEIARIRIEEDEVSYDVEFLIKEWSSVLGLAATLTGYDTRCKIKIREKKLFSLQCSDWTYPAEMSETSTTVVKAREFAFQRDGQKQFVVKGGFFKDLVEHRKFDILVPMEGKIKIIEKEIRVIDEFLEKRKYEVKDEKSEKDSEKNGDKEKDKKESSEKESSEVKSGENPQDVHEETFEENPNQEGNQTGQTENGEPASQDVSPPGPIRGRGR